MKSAAQFALHSICALVLGFRIGLSLVSGGPIDVGRVGVFLLAVIGLWFVLSAVAAGFRARGARGGAELRPALRAGSDSSITARWICVRTLFGGTRYPALHRPWLPPPHLVDAADYRFVPGSSVVGRESSAMAPPEAATRVRWVVQPAA